MLEYFIDQFRCFAQEALWNIWIFMVWIIPDNWALRRSSFTITPPFRPFYYKTLQGKALEKLELLSPGRNIPRHTLDICILSDHPVYFLGTSLPERIRFPTASPSPAVIWRYRNPKTNDIVSGLLHYAYRDGSIGRDKKALLKHVRWMRLDGGLFASDKNLTLHDLPSTTIDTTLISFLKHTPVCRMDSGITTKLGDDSINKHQMLDCGGFAQWLCGGDEHILHFQLDTTLIERFKLPSNGYPPVISGRPVLLRRVYHTPWRFSWLTGTWIRDRLVDHKTLHYAVKIFDDTFISKCGSDGGIFIGTFDQTLAFYSMDMAIVRF